MTEYTCSLFPWNSSLFYTHLLQSDSADCTYFDSSHTCSCMTPAKTPQHCGLVCAYLSLYARWRHVKNLSYRDDDGVEISASMCLRCGAYCYQTHQVRELDRLCAGAEPSHYSSTLIVWLTRRRFGCDLELGPGIARVSFPPLHLKLFWRRKMILFGFHVERSQPTGGGGGPLNERNGTVT